MAVIVKRKTGNESNSVYGRKLSLHEKKTKQDNDQTQFYTRLCNTQITTTEEPMKTFKHSP